jgi:hypothetical protein
MKAKMDSEQKELEKMAYTFDDEGMILFIKPPSL